MEASLEHLKSKGVIVDEIIEFTDHAAAQYKSKTVFHKMTKYDIPVTKHYFTVRHGKGPSDRAGGNFKCFIIKTIKIDIIHLKTCEDIVEYCTLKFNKQTVCTEEKENHSLKKVFYHKEIPRNSECPKLKVIPNTRKLHCIRNTGHDGILEKKRTHHAVVHNVNITLDHVKIHIV